MNLLRLLQVRLHDALSGLTKDPTPYAGLVRTAQDPKHGDYQANCAMSLAKELKTKPRELAEEIVRRLRVDDFAEAPQVAGPGFINFRLLKEWVAGQLPTLARDEWLGAARAEPARTFVI